MFDDYDYHKKMIDHFLMICNNYNNIKVVMSLMLAIFFCFFCYVVMFVGNMKTCAININRSMRLLRQNKG